MFENFHDNFHENEKIRAIRSQFAEGGISRTKLSESGAAIRGN